MKPLRKILPILLAFCLLFVPSFAASASEVSTGDAEIASREEVIYANLAADGTVRQVYVVTALNVSRAGTLTDYGDYSHAVNLTSTDLLTRTDNAVSVRADIGRLYYQGYLTQSTLPWDIRMVYTLDGTDITPDALAGKSGKLNLTITVTPASDAYCADYMMQITVTLDAALCENLETSATVANAGGNRVLTFTVLPDTKGVYTLTADVRDFEMDGVTFAALPMSFSLDDVDLGGMTEDFGKLSDAVTKIADGADELAEGARELTDGAKEFADGASSFGNGAQTLTENAAALSSAAAQIGEGLTALANASDSLEGLSQLSQLSTLPDALKKLSGALTSVVGGLRTLSESYKTAYAALDAAVTALPTEMLDVTALAQSKDPAVLALVGAYTEQYKALVTLTETYKQVKPAFDAVSTNLPTLADGVAKTQAGLNTLVTSLSGSLGSLEGLSELTELGDGLKTLSDSYGTFCKGLADYADGMKTYADSTASLAAAAAKLHDGTASLSDGAETLADGTRELADETDGLEDTVREKLDEQLEAYDHSDYIPPSFVSSRNEGTASVQFVFKTDAIRVPDAPAPTVEKAPATFWTRFLDLFR
ncbi:MAG: hypothetical protein GX929_02965 [Clostridiales bacterium]|nr:hypothetical protein [Clostridiales bacterium]